MKLITYKNVTGQYERHTDGADAKPYYFGTIGTPSVKDHITFQGDTLEELEQDFKDAAMEYLETYGNNAHRISLPDSLYYILKKQAMLSGQSVTNYIRHTLASVVL